MDVDRCSGCPRGDVRSYVPFDLRAEKHAWHAFRPQDRGARERGSRYADWCSRSATTFDEPPGCIVMP